jgi:hypothetical protein
VRNEASRYLPTQILRFAQDDTRWGRYIGDVRDNAVSKMNLDFETGPSLVTLSRSEGSVTLGYEMLRCGSA